MLKEMLSVVWIRLKSMETGQSRTKLKGLAVTFDCVDFGERTGTPQNFGHIDVMDVVVKI